MGKELKSKNIKVPNDLSSSAFFIVSALINKNSKLIIKNINNNPTRNGLLIALKKMGAKISLLTTIYQTMKIFVILKSQVLI